MFLARTDEQRRFTAALEDIDAAPCEERPSQVFLLHGLGGMGKTELCHRFCQIAQGEHPQSRIEPGRFLVATVNWQEERRNHGLRASEPTSVLPGAVFAATYDALVLPMEGAFERQPRKAKPFEPYAETMAKMRGSLSPGGAIHPFAPPATADPLSDFLGGLFTLGESAGAPGLGMAVGGLARAVRDADRARVRTSIDLERVDELLTRQFAAGVRGLSEDRPVVIVLDHFEIVASCGSWIRKAMCLSGPRVLWVVAARLEPEDEAGSSGDLAAFRREIPEQNLRVIAMTTFDRGTVREELEQRRVADIDEAMLETVESMTKGVPMAVSLVAGLLAQGDNLQEIGRAVTHQGDTTRLVRELAERHLIHTKEDPELASDAPLLLGLSLLYADRGDPDVLRAIWGKEFEIEAVLAELSTRHDFVLSGSRRLHQEVRETFRRYLLDGVRRAERRQSNHDAAEVVLARLNTKPYTSGEEGLRQEDWRLDAATLVWHRFWEGNDDGLRALSQVFPAAVLLNQRFAHELVEIASFFKDTFTEEHRRVVRGLASLLSFGSFLDKWRERRKEKLHRVAPHDPAVTERESALATLRKHSEDIQIEGLAEVGPGLVSLLEGKSFAYSSPSIALSNLTAASDSIPPDGGEFASQLARAASDLSAQLVEEVPDGKRVVPSAEAMRAGELCRVYSSSPDSALIWAGRAHRERDEIDEALTVYDELDELLEDHGDEAVAVSRADSYFGRARALRMRQDYQGAIHYYDRIVALADGNGSLRRRLAYTLHDRAAACEKLSGSGGASADLERLFAQFNDAPEVELRLLALQAANRRAYLLAQENEVGASVAATEELLCLPEDPDPEVRGELAAACLFHSSMLLRQRKWDEVAEASQALDARFSGEQDLRFTRMRAQALKNKGIALMSAGRARASIEAFDELIDRVGGVDDPEYRRLEIAAIVFRTKVLRQLGEEVSVEATRDRVEELLAKQPTAAPSHTLHALFLDETEAGVDVVKKSYEDALTAGTDPDAVGNFGRFRLEQGELEAGLALNRQVLGLSDADPDMQLHAYFCLSLFGQESQRIQNLSEVHRHLKRGTRFYFWDLKRLLSQAMREARADPDWFEQLAAVINDEEPMESLRGWSVYREATEVAKLALNS